MPKVFNYVDYREFLEDYYNEEKARNPSFSYQYFANRAGFKSKSFLKLVIDGKKNLSDDSLKKINLVLKLPSEAFSYFNDLVAFNQAASLKDRNLFFSRLTGYRKRSRATIILQSQYEFYSKWYYNTLRELVCMADFKDDFDKLGKMVRPPLTARMAWQSVELLQELGLIKKEGGRYHQTQAVISTGDEVKSLAVQNFHLQNMVVAAESLETTPSNRRDISCLILGLSENSFNAVKSEIQDFRKKLLKIAETEKKPTRVYHVNFQLFPTSEDTSNPETK